ncbi:MAG: KPN_02809 family neutral zinc metallopeptidase [Gammaproteobacteria bacterium]
MRWRGGRRSSNIEDRRGQRTGRRLPGGSRSVLPLLARLSRTRGGWVVIVGGLLFLWLSGADLGTLLGLSSGTSPQTAGRPVEQSAAERELVDFVSVVLADTEDVWTELFAAGRGKPYAKPRLVLFRGSTRSACGLGQAAMGPFYCPGDQKVYIDLSFFDDLRRRFAAPGDFAQAYVLAHEVGHHVQTLLGISARNHAARQRASKVEANRLSVRQELQADCFAGVWAHHADRARGILEQGDIEEALAAATAIGDDRLQRQGGGRVTPDTFTHGTSAQRVRWFRTGIEQGSMAACDTFAASRL